MLAFILSVYTVHALGQSFERKGCICQSLFSLYISRGRSGPLINKHQCNLLDIIPALPLVFVSKEAHFVEE